MLGKSQNSKKDKRWRITEEYARSPFANAKGLLLFYKIYKAKRTAASFESLGSLSNLLSCLWETAFMLLTNLRVIYLVSVFNISISFPKVNLRQDIKDHKHSFSPSDKFYSAKALWIYPMGKKTKFFYSIERRWSSRRFPYGYLVSTSSSSLIPPWAHT